MILTFKKGLVVRVSEHFKSNEFDCRCGRRDCTTTLICSQLLLGLEQLRNPVGALFLSCGYRCEAHNLEIGGAKDSQHCKGKAADVKAGRVLPFSVARSAEGVDVFKNGGIGVYRTFTHVDSRGYPSRWGWTRAC